MSTKNDWNWCRKMDISMKSLQSVMCKQTCTAAHVKLFSLRQILLKIASGLWSRCWRSSGIWISSAFYVSDITKIPRRTANVNKHLVQILNLPLSSPLSLAVTNNGDKQIRKDGKVDFGSLGSFHPVIDGSNCLRPRARQHILAGSLG